VTQTQVNREIYMYIENSIFTARIRYNYNTIKTLVLRFPKYERECIMESLTKCSVTRHKTRLHVDAFWKKRWTPTRRFQFSRQSIPCTGFFFLLARQPNGDNEVEIRCLHSCLSRMSVASFMFSNSVTDFQERSSFWSW